MDDAKLEQAAERAIEVMRRKRQLCEEHQKRHAAAEAAAAAAEKARALPPPQRPVSDDDLPIRTLHDLSGGYSRYGLAFARPDVMQLDIPKTQTPGPIQVALVPWIIEAPLNSVEILEAILEPMHPFQIHTARHVRRSCNRNALSMEQLKMQKRRYEEYIRLQGQLELDRDVSFVCIPELAVQYIRTQFSGVFTPVKLCYMSIPWTTTGNPHGGLVHPWALVLHNRSLPGTVHTYEDRLRKLLERIGLENCQFRRSLVPHGTTPLPENLWDWFAGRPGTTAALPYFASYAEAERNRKDVVDGTIDGKEGGVHQSEPGVIAPCCLPTVELHWLPGGQGKMWFA